MESKADRVFKWIWRLNGIILLILGIGSAIILGIVVADIGILSSRERPEQHIKEVAGTSVDYKTLRFADFEEVKGTSFLVASIGNKSKYIGSGSSSGVATARNLLFFNIDSLKAHWLLDTNSSIITSRSFVTNPPNCKYGSNYSECEASKVSIALLLETEPADSDKIDTNKFRSISIASPSGTDSHELASGVDALLGVNVIDKSKAIVFYSKAGAVRFMQINPNERTLISDDVLSTNR